MIRAINPNILFRGVMADTGRDTEERREALADSVDDLDVKAMGERRAALADMERVLAEKREDGEVMATSKQLKLRSYCTS